MSLTRLRVAGLALATTFALWALMLLGPDHSVRVEARNDRVVVLKRSGLWYHEYTVTVRRALVRDSGSSVVLPSDTVLPERSTLRITEAQHDALRTGARLRIHRFPLIKAFAWTVDESVILGFLRALGARTVRYQNPRSISPSPATLSGLARVLSVHRLAPRQSVFGAREGASANSAREIVVVEFWSQRLRTVVRTADVVDAHSIDDLGPGQILQMHYDQRTPRRMRLDDGMRTPEP